MGASVVPQKLGPYGVFLTPTYVGFTTFDDPAFLHTMKYMVMRPIFLIVTYRDELFFYNYVSCVVSMIYIAWVCMVNEVDCTTRKWPLYLTEVEGSQSVTFISGVLC